MNNNGYDPNNEFYNGYNSQNENNIGFYTGYNDVPPETEQGGMKDPFTSSGISDEERLYQTVRTRNISNYSFFGFGPVSMETVRQLYPNAKLASPADAMSRLIKAGIVALIALVIGIIFIVVYSGKDAKQTEFMENISVAPGVVQHILDGNKFPERLLGIKSYQVLYTYVVDGTTYKGSDLLTLDQLQSIGLPNGISSQNMGKEITVYVNKTDSTDTMLAKENYMGRGWLFFGIFAIIAAAFFCVGIKQYSDCISGKTAVFTNENLQKKYQRIR